MKQPTPTRNGTKGHMDWLNLFFLVRDWLNLFVFVEIIFKF